MRGCVILFSIIALVVLAPTLIIPLVHFFTIPLFVVVAIVLVVALTGRR